MNNIASKLILNRDTTFLRTYENLIKHNNNTILQQKDGDDSPSTPKLCSEKYTKELAISALERHNTNCEKQITFLKELLKKYPPSFCRYKKWERKLLSLHNPKKSFLICYLESMVKDQKTSKYKQSNYKKRISARANKIKDLCYNNFTINNCSVFTLTFVDTDEKAHELDFCQKEYKKFILRLKNRYDNIRYVTVMSRQKRGTWHFHMMCNIVGLSKNGLNKIWKNGFCHVRKITTDKIFYVQVQYLIKNMKENKDLDLMGKKGYLCSLNLQKSIILRDWNILECDEFSKQFNRIKKGFISHYHKSTQLNYYNESKIESTLTTIGYKYEKILNVTKPVKTIYHYVTIKVDSSYLFPDKGKAIKIKKKR